MHAQWIVDSRFSLDQSPLLAIGAARSGKSTLAQIASTYPYVDHLDDPFHISALAMGLATGTFSGIRLRDPIRCIVAELHNDASLLRIANFRPRDVSSIWGSKSRREIVSRMYSLRDRADSARMFRDQNYIMWLTLTDCNPHLDFLRGCFPGRPTAIILRHPLDVAQAIQDKRWFSDAALLSPSSNSPTWPIQFAGTTFHLPWWLPEEERESWLKADEVTRALVYWRIMHQDLDWHSLARSNGIEVFTFSEIVNRSSSLLSRLSRLLGRAPTWRTRKVRKQAVVARPRTTQLSAPALAELESLLPTIESYEL